MYSGRHAQTKCSSTCSQDIQSHFKSVLAGVSDDFPFHQWDELIPQTTLTLNLRWQLNVAPNVSAYAYHHGNFDHNRMPIAPMGTISHQPESTQDMGRAFNAWYLQTSPEHIRSHIVFVKASQWTRITDNVFFKHKYITQPTITLVDAIVKAYQDLTQAIQGISNSQGAARVEALASFVAHAASV
ncbi:LOW QUALITY PROTEIN: hypothetical protein ACHAW6_014020 [Cyclotella cf. meneghiniana]